MIKLLNSSKQALHLLTQVKDFYIESELQSADKIIHFLVPRNAAYNNDIKQENYLQTTTDRFVIKEINYSDPDFIEVFGKLDVEELRAKKVRNYESVEREIGAVLTEVLAGTGWTYTLTDVPVKNRTLREDKISLFSLIIKAINTYGLEVEFDSLNKVVKVKQLVGTNRNAYIYSDLNMRKLEYQSDTYDFITKLYAYGKDGLTFASLNGGKEYVENYSYSTKVIEDTWIDDRYTDAASLLADATRRLAQLAAPRRSYSVDVVELAKANLAYSDLTFNLGDSVKIIDKLNSLQETHRVVKLTEYPYTPEKNVVQLANVKIIFTDNSAAIRDVVTNEIVRVQTDLMTEIAAATDLIKAANGGYVVIRYNAQDQPEELIVSDNANYLAATKVWRWNVNGLGYSSTGYSGTYATAITADGKINADFITTGFLSANRIKAGLISSTNGQSWINLDTGYFKLGGMELGAGGFKITLGSGKTVETAISDAQTAAQSYADGQLSTYATTVNGTLNSLQDQIDGSITTWFYAVAPTNANAPANTWTTTDLKNNHLGDLYYDTVTGYSYRWQVVSNTYSWQRITDTDVTKALADAAKAQDTADNKRRVFSAQPTTPYDINDLWVQGTSGDIMRCTTARTTGSYIAGDWVKASKYTDDTVANTNLQTAKTYAETKATEARTAAEAYALAQAGVAEANAAAYADGVVDAEEQARINDAVAKLAEAKTYAETKATEAKNAAQSYSDTLAATKENAWIKSATEPAIKYDGLVWVDTSKEPNFAKRYVSGEWVAIGPSTASEIGAFPASEGTALASQINNINTKLIDGTITSTVLNSAAFTNLMNNKADTSAVGSQITQAIDGVRTTVTTAQLAADTALGKYNTIESYMTFTADGLTLGKNNSQMKVNITNAELQFLNGDKKVAYMSGLNLNIGNAVIESTIRIGVHELQKYNADITVIKWVG